MLTTSIAVQQSKVAEFKNVNIKNIPKNQQLVISEIVSAAKKKTQEAVDILTNLLCWAC